MPNWCTGVLKVRGKKENVLSLLAEFAPFIDVESDDETISIQSNDKIHAFCGVKRSTLKQGGKINDEFYIHDDEFIIQFDNVDIAWGLVPDDHGWCDLSKKFDIDFRWHGFEQGGQFHQDVEIIKGNINKDIDHTYDGNYDWDCVHPKWGG